MASRNKFHAGQYYLDKLVGLFNTAVTHLAALVTPTSAMQPQHYSYNLAAAGPTTAINITIPWYGYSVKINAASTVTISDGTNVTTHTGQYFHSIGPLPIRCKTQLTITCTVGTATIYYVA